MAEELKIAGIILAAGSASRMRQTKQTLPLGHTTILGRVIEHAQASCLDKLVLVLGHKAGEIKKDIQSRFKEADIDIVLNPDYQKGQSTSLISGVRGLPNDINAAMFLLADQPMISKDIINPLIESYKKNSSPIVIPFFQNRRGNPVIIDKSLFSELKSLKKDTGARAIFQKYQNRILRVDVENQSVLIDIDTPEDYRKALAIMGMMDEG